MSVQKYLECGKAVSTHGVRGTLKLECYCNDAETLAKLRKMYVKLQNNEYAPMKVMASAVQKNMVLVTFENIKTVDEAIKYKGTVFYADRDDISRKKGDVFIADMIGLDVIDEATNEKYGVLKEVISPAGRDIYVVSDVNGGEFMIPAVNEFIRDIDVVNGCISVHLIEGMRE